MKKTSIQSVSQSLAKGRFTRRSLLQSLAALAALPSGLALAAPNLSKRRLVLVELEGGNDGLNTVVPFSQKRYYNLPPYVLPGKTTMYTLPWALATPILIVHTFDLPTSGVLRQAATNF